MADLWSLCKPKNVEEGLNKSGDEENLLFRGTPIKQDEQELSMQNETQQTKHNPTPTSHLSLETINPQLPLTSNLTL
jgi:hypothetical protein